MVSTRRSTPTVTEAGPSNPAPPITGQGSTTQGEDSQVPPLTQPQGTTPQGTETLTNPLQMVIAPLSGRPLPHGAQISTTVLPLNTNPMFGLPYYPPQHEPYDPPYTGGSQHNLRLRDYSGSYSDSSSEDRDRDEAPRRRRASREPHMRSQRIHDGPSANALERIQALEAEIQRLKEDIARGQQRQGRPQPRIPIVDLHGAPRRQRRMEIPQTEAPRPAAPRPRASYLILLGKPNNPIPPFTEEVMRAHISRKFKMPTIKTYDGTGDPANHVRTFSNALLLQPASDALKCRAFPQTLAGMAQRWYSRLPPNSIGSFEELSDAFISQFISGGTHEKSSASLMDVVQGENESLRDYIKRFTKETLGISDLQSKIAMVALQNGTTNVFFKMSLAKHPPEDMTELQRRVSKYIKAEDSMEGNDNPKKRRAEQEYDARDRYPRTSEDSDSPPTSDQDRNP